MILSQLITIHVPRHRHLHAYAALVLEGSYLGRGSSGRRRVECASVVSHAACEVHDDLLKSQAVWVCNIPLPPTLTLPAVFSVADPDDLALAVKQDPREAYRLLEPVQAASLVIDDWPDILAAVLRRSSAPIGEWAAEAGLTPATVTRGFARRFLPADGGRRPINYLKSLFHIFEGLILCLI